MSNIDTTKIADRLNRMAKLFVDTGEAASIEEAEAILGGYRLAVSVGPDVRYSPTLQAALLTIINTGRRSFLGGVEVAGAMDMPLLLPLASFSNLTDAVAGLGGNLVREIPGKVPLIVVGDGNTGGQRTFSVRTTFEGWSGGIAPVASSVRLHEKSQFVPSGILSGALAVAEAFQHLRGNHAAAGRRATGLSIWRPELDWHEAEAAGPSVDRLPSDLWLIGLGNLGQAYLWTLGLLPYAAPDKVHLVLQDFDVLAESNESTSILTSRELVGTRKTRAMASWAERQGFSTSIVERRFGADFRVNNGEPLVALCGVDNALARTTLEDVGFSRVIEAGLGKGTSDYLGFQTHVFPSSRTARDLWAFNEGSGSVEMDRPAYRALAAAGVDQCGLTQLAGRTVGAPFVGTVAATMVIGEAIRLANGAHAYEAMEGHLRSLEHRTIVPASGLPVFNPGSIQLRVA